MDRKKAQAKVVDVFVSSPSDLEEERDILGEVIDELNRSSDLTVLRLIRWETHGVPGIGSSPQDLLNKELSPEDADIFIGLMWMRFGTPTDNAGSGTEEEFNRAIERYCDHNDAIRIMFYFKTSAPTLLNEIDVDQLSQVRRFKASLSDKGVLYSEFDTLDTFTRNVRVHLRTLQAQDHQVSIGQPEAEADCTVISEDHDEDELGLLDLMDRFADSTESLSEIANGISEETEAIGERLSHHTKEIASVNDQSSNTPIVQSQLRSKAKRTINRAATDLFAYAVSLRTKLPLFDQYLSEGVEAAGQVAVLSVTDLNPGRERIAEAMQSLDVLYKSIGDTIESMTGFRDSALKLPRLTSKLSRARRETADVLQKVINSLKSAHETLSGARRALGAVSQRE